MVLKLISSLFLELLNIMYFLIDLKKWQNTISIITNLSLIKFWSVILIIIHIFLI